MKQLLLQFFLILVNAFFASAEIALISVNGARLEKLSQEGNKKAKKVLALTRQPARFLATIQVGITLAGFLGSAFAASNFSSVLAARLERLGLPLSAAALETASLVAITLVLSLFTLVLGELVPKRVAMKKAELLAFFIVDFISVISRLFSPLVWFLTQSTNAILRLFRLDPNAEDETVTEEEIRMMVDAGSKRGAINAKEQEIIHNVFEFDNRAASEVMTHRTATVMLHEKDSDAEWHRTITENRHDYYPITGESFDEIKGVLSAKDWFRLEKHDRASVLAGAVSPAVFVPETAKADVLFRNMKKSRHKFAVVMDEYGGMSGIITMNDLLEAIVGDFDGADDPEMEKIGENLWRISGSAPLDRVERALRVDFPDGEEYDTFGGYVFSLLGEIPPDGTGGKLEDGIISVEVEMIRDRRLQSALVRVTGSDTDTGGGQQEEK